MRLDDVASCVLYFSSVSTFWHVFLLAEVLNVLAQSDRVSKYPLRR